MPDTYTHAILGGTFDHFHLGHQKLIETAFSLAEKVTIGISKPELYQNKVLPLSIEEYSLREQAVKDFIDSHFPSRVVKYVPITSKYGTTLTDQTIDAIIVSPDTEPVAKVINEERQSKNLPPLSIITVPFVLGDDDKPISSERIRLGEINRTGKSYYLSFLQNPSYHLPASLRPTLKQPIGEVLGSPGELKTMLPSSSFLITVGDIVTTSLLEGGITPRIAVIDLRTQRHELSLDLKQKYFQHTQVSLINPPGEINQQIASIFESALEKTLKDQSLHIIRVDGEEDLLALPVILLAPLNALVIYGQYEVGMVAVTITEEKKRLAQQLLSQFV